MDKSSTTSSNIVETQTAIHTEHQIRSVVLPHPTTFTPRPKAKRLRLGDVIFFVLVNLLIIFFLWYKHNGIPKTNFVELSTAIGQISALYGTFVIICLLLLIARTPSLDQLFGADVLMRWHRWLGFSAVWLLFTHLLASTLGWAASEQTNFFSETWSLIQHEPNMLAAYVSLGLFLLIGFTSVKVSRRRLSYETWYYIHIYSYLALLFGFAHQFAIGADFVEDKIARFYWILLYLFATGAIVSYRFVKPIVDGLWHSFRIDKVIQDNKDTVSLYLIGKRLDDYLSEAGQYVTLRVFTRKHWWKPHPFSFSSVPTTNGIRLTIKAFGDDTTDLLTIKPGTKVFLEGPYGSFTEKKRTKEKVLLIGGGVGITPLRALFEQIEAKPGDVTLLYRASNWDDVLFKEEFDAIAAQKGFHIQYAVGPRTVFHTERDPFSSENINIYAPDVINRDVYICGPKSLTSAAYAGLKSAGVPKKQIHFEDFTW